MLLLFWGIYSKTWWQSKRFHKPNPDTCHTRRHNRLAPQNTQVLLLCGDSTVLHTQWPGYPQGYALISEPSLTWGSLAARKSSHKISGVISHTDHSDRLPSGWMGHAAYNDLFSLTMESSFSLAKALETRTAHIWIHLVQDFFFFFFFLKNMKPKTSGEGEKKRHYMLWMSHVFNIFKANFKLSLRVEKLFTISLKMKTWRLRESKVLAKITQRVDQGLELKSDH